jgi:hypothetical protein
MDNSHSYGQHPIGKFYHRGIREGDGTIHTPGKNEIRISHHIGIGPENQIHTAEGIYAQKGKGQNADVGRFIIG